MIPIHIAEQFTKKIDYLISAIVEELEGKVPTEQEKRANCRLLFERAEGKTTVYWKDKLIFEAILLEKQDEAIEGSFNLPEQFAQNTYIQNTINKWNN